MKRPAVSLYSWCVAVACVATVACAKHRPDDEVSMMPSARVADSVRDAAAEQSRTTASQGVTFTDAERNRFARVEHMIQAKFAGVQVTQAPGGFAIRIRGTGSFNSSNEPLVLIDGVTRSVSDLGKLSPKDIDRIAIVKDASASFYGVRGANGVILISTRRGP
jgi:TonB-dependent SusC/RagA subfamily outer membrane receptor